MSEQNKALTRRFYEEVFNRKNMNALDDLCAPDFKDHTAMPGQAPGLNGMKEMMGVFVRAFPDMKVTIEDLIAEGDLVAARIAVDATHKGELFGTAPTNKKITFHATDMVRFKNGKATDAWHYGDDLIALMQLGVQMPS